MAEQKIQLINAISFAKGTTEPSNREVWWIDDNITGNVYNKLKYFNVDSGSWELVQRTAAQLLLDLKTVDGAGSGLDADTLDGYTAAELLQGEIKLSSGEILVGQLNDQAAAKTLSGIATIDVNGALSYVANSISHTGLTDIGSNTHAQIDTHIADSTIHFTQASIDHTAIQNIGVNTHAQIDSHISSTANPHGVTAAQVGNTTAQWNANSIEGNLTNVGVLGAGQDGQALVWDNATSRFITATVSSPSLYTGSGTVPSSVVATLTDTLTFKSADQTTATNLNIVDSLSNNLLNVNNQGKLTVNLQGTGGLNYAFEVNTTDGVAFQVDRSSSITWWRNGTPELRLLQDVYKYYNNAGTKLLNTIQYDASVHPFGGEGLEYTPLNAQMRINGDVSLNNINVFEELQIRGTYLGIGKGTLSQIGSETISLQGRTLVSDKFEIQTTTAGFLMPRMTTAQKNAIAAPDTHLFVFDTDLGTIERYDGTKWVTQAGNGVLGIANSDGSYVYYGDYNSAIAAASAGDTIEQFGDIVETGAVSLTIDKNLTIQMNGYSYTLDYTGTTDCVYLSSTSLTDVKILNGTINRINGTGGRCLYSIYNVTTKPTLNLEGTTLYTDLNATGSLMWITGDFTVTGGLYTGAGNILMDTDSTLTNFTYNGSGYVGAWRNRVMISNGYIYTTNSTYGLFVNNEGEASNVTVKVNGTGDAIYNAGKISNCEGYSSGGIGIYANAGASLDGTFNCYGYSDSSYGIQVSSGNIHNCVGRSVGSYGMIVDLRNNPEVVNCTAWSSANAGMGVLSSGSTGRIVNCFAQSELNTTSGHAFLMANGTCRFINCTGKVANAGAYGISSTSSANAYITNFTGEGMTTLFNGVTNLQVNTQDAYGNKLIG